MKERDLRIKVGIILQRLRSQNVPIWWFSPSAGTRSTPGIPDIIACVRGRFVGLELKTETGSLRPTQIIVLDKIARCGGYVLLVRPSNLGSLQTILENLGVDHGI